MCIARYSLAVDRRFKREGEPTADFLNCVAFGKNGEFAEKYLKKGIKINVTGHIQTGSYTNRDGQKVYTTDIVVDSSEFCDSKATSQQNAPQAGSQPEPNVPTDAFVNIPDNIEDLPFS
jgi:single-strand DNA-binding protein